MKRIIYSKFQSVYKPEYLVCTSLVKDIESGLIEAVKSPMTEESKKHLQDMLAASVELKTVFLAMDICSCNLCGDELHFPFVNGESFLRRLLLAAEGEREAYLQLWQGFLALLEPVPEQKCDFYTTSEFKQMFGDGTAFIGEPAYKICSFDLTPANVLVDIGQRPVLIDYEWFFKVPVPIALVKYHTVVTSCKYYPDLVSSIDICDLIKLCGLHAKQMEYESALKNFLETVWDNELIDSLQLYMKPCNATQDYESQRYITALEERINKMLAWEESQQKTNEEAWQYISSLEERINKMLAWEESQQKANEEAHQYIGSLEERINKMLVWEESQQKANEEAQQYISSLEERINKMLAWEESQQKASEETQQYIGSLESKLNQIGNQVKCLHTDNERLKQTLKEIYTSLRWRIMHPFYKRDE